jgi:hypothetical protein
VVEVDEPRRRVGLRLARKRGRDADPAAGAHRRTDSTGSKARKAAAAP